MSPSDLLKNAIRELLEKDSLANLKKASAELSDRYRHRIQKSEQLMDSESIRHAYLLCRMPATYAAIHRVFTELQERLPGEVFEGMLDVGAGPGTAWWAALDTIPSIQRGTFLEKDPHMINLGKELAANGEDARMGSLLWKHEDIVRTEMFDPHPLVSMSYVLGELSPEDQASVLEKGWKAAEKALVLIEPGTPKGFQTILRARTRLLALGGHMVAPCPHAGLCPMKGEDWCHFSVRIERTKEHRQVKEGTLSYEDEKYSYIIISKNPHPLPDARVLSPPLKRSGHFLLKLCTPEGIKQEIISKRNGEAFKKARKLEWGSNL